MDLDLRIISELLPWGLKLRESSGSSSHWGIFEYRPPSLHRTPAKGVSRGPRLSRPLTMDQAGLDGARPDEGAAEADARFPGMDGIPPGGNLPDPGVPPEIRVLMNTPLAAWTDEDWHTAGWVQITDPEVARSIGVSINSYMPSMPSRVLGPGEPNHLEAEWLQLGWTRRREDPLDPLSPVPCAVSVSKKEGVLKPEHMLEKMC